MSLIAKVEQNGSSVYAYSAGGSVIWVKNGYLVSWTSREVSIQEGGSIYVYDETGKRIA